MAESTAVQQILQLNNKHRKARAAAKRLEKKVGTSRLDAARTNKKLGKLGVAYVYLERALELNKNDREAKKELEDVKAQLKERLDLILLVEPVKRQRGVSGAACLGFDEMLREEIMTDASKRTDLGGYVLSPGWTKAVKEKNEKAPEVSGSISVEVKSCKTTPAGGKVAFSWQVLVPRQGSVAAKAELQAELPVGIIPVDEQDEAGNNAKSALAEKSSRAFLESLENEREGIELWLLTLGEHAVKNKDVTQAADAYARLSIQRPASIDPGRLSKIQDYLTKEIR